MFNYIFNGKSHTDVSQMYMNSLGMTAEQIESVLQQKEFEDSQALEKQEKLALQDEIESLHAEIDALKKVINAK